MRNFLILTVPTLFLCGALGEALFTFVIPACEQPWGYYDPSEKIAQLQVGQGSGLYTIGKLAQQRGKWRVNNAGWNSDIDYLQPNQRKKPLIAIIGDSYIEALQVNVEESIVSVLRRKVEHQYDVYGFGISGAPLSEYLQMSRYVRKHFDPDVVIINVVQYDLEESVLSGASEPYFLEIDMSNGKPKESKLLDTLVTAQASTKLVFKSAILRYLWHNLKLGESVTRFRRKHNGETGSMADEAEAPSVGNTKIYHAVDYILKIMRDEDPLREYVLLVDAPRRDIYNGTEVSSDLRWMHKVLADLAGRYRFRIVDLSGPFQQQYEKDKIKFDSDLDYHWNEHGHEYAAEVLFDKLSQFGSVRSDSRRSEYKLSRQP